MKYRCELCGMVYHEEIGDAARGIPAGTLFADLPEDHECPGCGMKKEAFYKVGKVQRICCKRKSDEMPVENAAAGESQR